MAKPSWLSITPMSGSGDGTLSNSASEHTGRVARHGKVTVTGTGVPEPATYDVSQAPKKEFASFNNGSSMSADKNGGTITISGKSNSFKLTFSWVGEVGDVEIPGKYQANGVNVNNGSEILGDPGATAQFAFSLPLEIPKNDTTSEVTRTLKVVAHGGQSAQISIVQAEGDPRISVSPQMTTLTQAGTAVSVAVKSNTTWTVS